MKKNDKPKKTVAEKAKGKVDTGIIARLVNRYPFSLSVEESYAVTSQCMETLFPGDSGVLYMKDAKQDLYLPAARWGDKRGHLKPIDSQECWALRRGRMHKIMARSEDIYCSHIVSPAAGKSYLCVPIITLGENLGLIHFATRSGARVFAEKRQAVRLVTDLLSMAIVNIRLRGRIQDMIDRDYSTGLFNRGFIEEKFKRLLKTAMREQSPIGLVMMDIDHFGYFTENYGHGAASAVLRDLGDFLTGYLGRDDLACRYGADEFLLVLPGHTLGASRKRAENIHALIKERGSYEEHRQIKRITLSIGVAAYPDHGGTADDLIQSVKNALKQAKQAGRDRIAVGE